MPSNPITPLQQAKRDLNLAIDDYAVRKASIEHAQHKEHAKGRALSARRNVDMMIDELIAQAQVVVITQFEDIERRRATTHQR